jgi:hypothetical protein
MKIWATKMIGTSVIRTNRGLQWDRSNKGVPKGLGPREKKKA